jgi:hypothetical protein
MILDAHCGCQDCEFPEDSEEKILREENRLLREEIERNAARQAAQRNSERKYLPTLAELLDRLTITQIKEVKIPEHKDKYAQEIREIVHDIDLILNDDEICFNAEMLRALVVLSQMNLHIWNNEANYRKGIKDGNQLELSHGLNGIRNTAKNVIQDTIGGRKDYKIDCIAAEFKDWEVSW